MYEIWTPLVGTGNNYHVSNLGRIFSSRADRILPSHVGQSGYDVVEIFTKNKKYIIRVDMAVARRFCQYDKNSRDVKHLDGNIGNCAADNLIWV